MKGICVHKFGGPECLELVDLPDPVPAAGQVLIEVAGASVNFADLKARAGAYHLGKQPPFIPGIDLAGTIVSVGTGVKNFKTGDRVVAFSSSGSYAEKCVADEQLTFAIPGEFDFSIAAAFPLAAGAAMHMLTAVAKIKQGESILIHGASGGVGSAAVQLAAVLGASPVVATTGSSWKKKYLQDLGATHVVETTELKYPHQLLQSIGDGKFDIILNPIGGTVLEQDLGHLGDFGRLVVFGKMSNTAASISPETLHGANKTVCGFSFGHYRKFKPREITPTIRSLLDLIAVGRLKVHVDRSFNLKDAFKAHKLMEERQITGKIILVPERA